MCSMTMPETERGEAVRSSGAAPHASACTSELRSALAPLRAESLPELPDARIEEDLAELQRVCELIEIERLRRVAEVGRRGLFARDGHLSVAAWLAARFALGWGAAREQVRHARGLEQMPGTRAALGTGEISISALGVLVRAREAEPETFAGAEAALVDAARVHTVAELARVSAFWRERVGRERVLRATSPGRGGAARLGEPRRDGARRRGPRSLLGRAAAHGASCRARCRGPVPGRRRRTKPRRAPGRRPGGDLPAVARPVRSPERGW